MGITIYDLSMKDMRKLLRAFHETVYGRTVFFLAYFIPISIFIASVVIAIVGFCIKCDTLLTLDASLFLSFVPCFILANIYYYAELRKFVAAGKFKK